MKSPIGKATKAESLRIERMKPIGCVACAHIGLLNLEHLELHHLLEGGRRLGHLYTIFLCSGHHRADWSDTQLIQLPADYRVSISDGRKRFIQIFGTERSLWERVQVTINDPTEWPQSKIVARRVHG
jgi:hypothetical protein